MLLGGVVFHKEPMVSKWPPISVNVSFQLDLTRFHAINLNFLYVTFSSQIINN